MAAVTVCSNFGAQENKICHCFHCFPIYLPWSDGTRCHDLSFLNIEFQACSTLSWASSSSAAAYSGKALCFWNFLSFRRVAKWPPACCYHGPCSWVRRWSQIPACRGDCIRAPCRKGLAVGLSRRIWVLVLGLSISSCVSRHDLHPPCGSVPSLALICPPRGTAVIMKQTK